MASLDGKFFQGRILHILASRIPHNLREGKYEDNKNSVGYKQQKETSLKETASSSHNWNALFMRSDAVGDAVASRFGVDKRDLLSSVKLRHGSNWQLFSLQCLILDASSLRSLHRVPFFAP